MSKQHRPKPGELNSIYASDQYFLDYYRALNAMRSLPGVDQRSVEAELLRLAASWTGDRRELCGQL